MESEDSKVLKVFKIILFGILSMGIMLSAPTGWIYDLWAGTGTGQGQKPGESVRTIESREETAASFSDQVPATISGGRLVACPLMRLRDVEAAGTHYTGKRGSRRQVTISEYIAGNYPLSPLQRFFQGIVSGSYNRYHLTELEDGSYLCVYFDDYLNLTGTDHYPVGYVRSATTQERRMLEQMAADYDVDAEYVLDMYRHGKVSWVTDMLLRFGVLVVLITIITVVWDSIKKRSFLPASGPESRHIVSAYPESDGA